MDGRVVVVMKGYPRLSETFIAQELLGLERAGLRLAIMAMRRPTDGKRHPIHDEIAAPVRYLPEYLHWEPWRVVRSFARIVRLPRFRVAARLFWHDLWRDMTRDRVRRFGQAAVLAAEMPPDARWLYAHFLHTPSSVTRYASAITGLGWSCSAHAKDIWTSQDWDIAGKLASAAWAVTCTSVGAAHLQSLSPGKDRVRLMYHGLDLTRFAHVERPRQERDGTVSADPVALLTVGRAVAKKGFDVLLQALAGLPSDCHWHLTHVGDGEQLPALRAAAERLGLAERISWLGAQDQLTVLARYRSADVFVLPCRVAESGDRDGLPNVLMEAQSQALACLSTTAGAVSELIIDGVTGVLVSPDDSSSLSQALVRLIAAPALRATLGRAGEDRVRAHFNAHDTIPQLVDLLAGAASDPREKSIRRVVA